MLQARVERGGGELAVLLELDGIESVVHFSGLPAAPSSNDFLVPLLLAPAMSRGVELRLPTATTGEYRGNTAMLQSIFATWFEGFTEIEITPAGPLAARPSAKTSPSRSACFFSGGVDSFFSVLELLDELDALIVVSGFDFGLGREHEPSEVLILERLVAAADELGVMVVHIETDLRQWSERFVRWGEHYCGSALAAVGLMLESTFDRVYIPSTFTYNEIFPYGSHPLTDPLWSTAAVSLRMHGCHATRRQKVARIATSSVAMRTLRVCWENRDGAYNCGRCSKCIRTMADLWAVEALEQCETLPNEIDATLLPAALSSHDPGARVYSEGIISAFKHRGGPEGEAFLKAAIAAQRDYGEKNDRRRS